MVVVVVVGDDERRQCVRRRMGRRSYSNALRDFKGAAGGLGVFRETSTVIVGGGEGRRGTVHEGLGDVCCEWEEVAGAWSRRSKG